MPGREARISPTLEEYLEALAHDENTTGVARLGVVADAISVKPSTASTALQSLCERGLVEKVGRGLFRLTTRGRHYNNNLTKRHEMLARFFEEHLGLSAENADREACQLEHHISDELAVAIKKHLEDYIDIPKPK